MDMQMSIDEMKAAVAASEAERMQSILPPGFRRLDTEGNVFYLSGWILSLDAGWRVRDPAKPWRASRCSHPRTEDFSAIAFGATPAEAIRACKVELCRIADLARAAADELPGVTP